MRASSAILLSAALLAGAAGAGEAPPGVPGRVVSINLCTDQLAMLLAGEGQLVSVSYLARDPRSSAMAEAARAWPVNRARAEEIFLLAPDLVLGGTFSTPGTVAMLRRMGVRVALLPPAESLSDIPAHLRTVGRLLGQEAKGRGDGRGVRHPPRRAARAARHPPPPRSLRRERRTSGQGGLSAEIVDRAGFLNITAELDLPDTGRLALERLVLADPDLVLTAARFPGASQAEAILDHPALAALTGARDGQALRDADWTCGLPQALDAVDRLVDLRLRLETRP
jgi:iron complex transport system substrate-binding protein